MKEVNPKETTRAYAFEIWMDAPCPWSRSSRHSMSPGSPGGRLCLCDWVEERRRDIIDRRLRRILRADYVEGDSEVIREASRQLDEYFAGRLR